MGRDFFLGGVEGYGSVWGGWSLPTPPTLNQPTNQLTNQPASQLTNHRRTNQSTHCLSPYLSTNQPTPDNMQVRRAAIRLLSLIAVPQGGEAHKLVQLLLAKIRDK